LIEQNPSLLNNKLLAFNSLNELFEDGLALAQEKLWKLLITDEGIGIFSVLIKLGFPSAIEVFRTDFDLTKLADQLIIDFFIKDIYIARAKYLGLNLEELLPFINSYGYIYEIAKVFNSFSNKWKNTKGYTEEHIPLTLTEWSSNNVKEQFHEYAIYSGLKISHIEWVLENYNFYR